MTLTKVLADELPRWPQVEQAYWHDAQFHAQLHVLSEYVDLTRDVMQRQPWMIPPGAVDYVLREIVVRVLMSFSAGAEEGELAKRMLSVNVTPQIDPTCDIQPWLTPESPALFGWHCFTHDEDSGHTEYTTPDEAIAAGMWICAMQRRPTP